MAKQNNTPTERTLLKRYKENPLLREIHVKMKILRDAGYDDASISNFLKVPEKIVDESIKSISRVEQYEEMTGTKIIPRNRKVTWNTIREDFKKYYPRQSKRVCEWRPHSYATIKLWTRDGLVMLYNYDEHRATILSDECRL